MKTYLLSAVVAGLFATSSAMAGDFAALKDVSAAPMTEKAISKVEGGLFITRNNLSVVNQKVHNEVYVTQAIGGYNSGVFGSADVGGHNTQNASVTINTTQRATVRQYQ